MARLKPPVRVGIVGCGYFGAFHFDAWSRIPDVEIVGICALDRGLARPFAEKYGLPGQPIPVFEDAAEMAANLQTDLVDVTAPSHAHLPLIEAVAPHTSHIICQKPFCGNLEAARRAIATANDDNVKLAVHENFRFQPWYRAIHDLLSSGNLGTVYQVTFRLRPGDGQGPDAYLDRQPYFRTMERFLVHETAIHYIDVFRYLFGEPKGLFAHLSQLNPTIAGEDAGMLILDFDNNVRGLIDGNRLADHNAENLRRTMGEMLIEGSRATLRLGGDGRIWIRQHKSTRESEHRYDWKDGPFGGDCVYQCNRHIVESWLAGAVPETEATAYVRNQEIEEAVYESARIGQYLCV